MPVRDDAAALVELRGLSKRFGANWALDGVDLRIDAGEIHGLLGQNGSGKSTLIKVLAGYHAPDAGELRLNGRVVSLPLSARQLKQHRIRFVHQDLALIPSLTVLENFLSGDFGLRRGLAPLRWRRESAAAREVFATYGLDLDPNVLVRDISRLARAQLAIARAVRDLGTADDDGDGGLGLLVLDEPTAFLPRDEADNLFRLMRAVTDRGAGVLFVSHDLEETVDITDRVTVIRDGKLVGTVATQQTTTNDLISMIIGHTLAPRATVPESARPTGDTDVRVSSLSGPLVREASFEIRHGEVLGITGLIGSGFEQIPYMLFGARHATAGELGIGPDRFAIAPMTPRRAMDAGLALIPNDRAVEGSAPSLTIGENVALPTIDRISQWGRISESRLTEYAASLTQELDVRPSDPRLPYAALSGGNQQKVLLAKWLATNPRLLLISEPTQGVDVGAREQIFRLIRGVAAQGCRVLCASSDLDQLAQVCTRVLVFRRGRITDEVSGGSLTKHGLTEVLFRSDAAVAQQS
ncbi:MAG: monosaccharide transporter ATP-binding protein family [Blastococcus sp.]|nr:monosaccharide transporter ATP-binding protein family [Blastococcus sp.]